MSLLRLDGLTKEFRGVRAIQGVTFAVEAGRITSVVGPNGAGKSTLFNMISGYLRPTSGRVHFKGEDITELPTYRIAQRGIVRAFQIAKPFPELSVQKNVAVAAIFGKAGERDVEETVAKSIELCRLRPHTHTTASQLSVGNLRRLELGRAIAARPELLLADEPFAGLNETETHEMGEVLKSICGSGVTVILVEHDIKAVRRISDRVIVLETGRMIADGSADEVFSSQAVIDAYLGVA
jgi:ABC-type branched-subunit amino acid transport system ATPase component